jgi:hypothetical protein
MTVNVFVVVRENIDIKLTNDELNLATANNSITNFFITICS